jgi:DNA-binding LytR/AlgR family response regulator
MKECLFIRHKREFFRLAFADIIYIESLKNYIRIVTAKDKFMIRTTISKVENLLPKDHFCRIHRGYIVALGVITGFNHTKVHIQQKDLPLGGQYRKALMNCLITLEDNQPGNGGCQSADINGLVDNVGLN